MRTFVRIMSPLAAESFFAAAALVRNAPPPPSDMMAQGEKRNDRKVQGLEPRSRWRGTGARAVQVSTRWNLLGFGVSRRKQ